MIGLLRRVESALQTAIEGTALSADEVQPLDLVRQIEREIERNRKVFVNDQVYVPHKLGIHLFAPSPSKVEEYEALFNNPEFRTYLEDYIKGKGYTLLDRIRIVIHCEQERLPQFGKRQCFVEFSWPQVAADPGEMTVVFDPADDRRIASVQEAKVEVLEEAWVEVVEGRAREPRVRITRREFNIGRGEHVVNHQTGRVLRVNHLAFLKPEAGGAVNRSVSRQHARILHRDGRFLLFDTGSQNGTSVVRGSSTVLVPRGAGVDGVHLQDGDVIAIGRARVRFALKSEGDAQNPR